MRSGACKIFCTPYPVGSRDPQPHDDKSNPLAATNGGRAAARWLAALDLAPLPRWFVEIGIAGDRDTHFELGIYAEEWGFEFRHGSRASWIRVTDVPFVHGRDDYNLLDETPDLLAIGALVAKLERTFGVQLLRASPSIRTNVPASIAAIRAWIAHAWPAAPRRKPI